MDRLNEFGELLHNPFFLLLLLVGSFQGCIWLRDKYRSQLINPTLMTTVVVIAVLLWLDLP